MQHVFLRIARFSLSRVIDLFVVEDVFKKETQKIVSFFKCEEGNETETSKILNKEWAAALAASDKGSYFEQGKLLL